ncbi:SEC-C metal-binding domain-containing protein [Roseospira navarrensis]|uniref:SEC-C metal-binding domain-containing protein n=1 Tax=Roseospira navarrensis TaxID=140058 RepID=UPI001FE3E416|nr:SEC-C metal-binding domain-containing protein [Roseospira navarrensis]
MTQTLDVDAILTAFADEDGPFPAEAVQACLDTPDAVVPRFLDILTREAENKPLVRPESEALFLIAHVLAELREPNAFGPLVQVLRGDADEVAITFGDGLIDDRDADEDARGAALLAWTWCAVTGVVDAETARDRVHTWADTLADEDDALIWMHWIYAVAMLGMVDLRDRVAPRLDPPGGMIPLMEMEDFDGIVAACRTPEGLAKEMADRGMTPHTDTIGRLSRWAGYSEEARADRAKDPLERALKTIDAMYDDPEIAAQLDADPALAERLQEVALAEAGIDLDDDLFGPDDDLDWDAPGETVRNPYRDVGRNDPCPCGSGKKFKKCCLDKG